MQDRWLPRQQVPAALHGVKTKLDRAEVHLDAIERVVADLLNGYSTAVTSGPRENAKIPFHLEGAPPIPEDLPAIVGDALHNMRSALDHLAWQLVRKCGGTPTATTSFPLRMTRRLGGDGLPSISGGVSDEVRTLLDEVQPYQLVEDAPDSDARIHPLAVLAELNNIDKHRELVFGVAVVSSGSWSSDIGVRAEFERGPKRSVVNGDHLGHLVIEPADAEVHDFQLDFAIRLLEDTEAGYYARFGLLEWGLSHALRAVEYRVLRRFLPLFAE